MPKAVGQKLIKSQILQLMGEFMPPSGFNKKAVEGLLVFLEGCYEDLMKEMDQGTDPKQAVQKELDDIRKFLQEFTIEK